MNLTDELQQLADLHADGSLSATEFNAAKARLLAGPQAGSTSIPNGREAIGTSYQLQQLHQDALIAQLDREWALEREQYLVGDRRGGSRSLPNEGVMIAAGIFTTIFGTIWTLVMSIVFFPFALFGLGFTALAIWATVLAIRQTAVNCKKAREYSIALARYEARRAELLQGADLPNPAGMQTELRVRV